MWNRWIVANLIVQILVNVLIVITLGPVALGYLAVSTFFALGLHPLGGRWIQEHYVSEEGQETYSYYGPLNRLCFNMGFHNEHHDFANIPWNNLPKLRKLAPEIYDSLKSYKSWTGVVFDFIFNENMSTYSRIVRRTVS
jgi:sphingolipid delta-4 desaturase